MDKQSKRHLMISVIIVIVAALFMFSFVVAVNKSPTGMISGNLEECVNFKQGMCSVCNNINSGVCSEGRLSYIYEREGCGEWTGC